MSSFFSGGGLLESAVLRKLFHDNGIASARAVSSWAPSIVTQLCQLCFICQFGGFIGFARTADVFLRERARVISKI